MSVKGGLGCYGLQIVFFIIRINQPLLQEVMSIVPNLPQYAAADAQAPCVFQVVSSPGMKYKSYIV